MKDLEPFVRKMQQRLAQGALDYGNRSFRLAPTALLNEIEEEIVDVAVWSFILWTRLASLEKRLGGRDDERAERRSTTSRD
jgi:hypothetical protein